MFRKLLVVLIPVLAAATAVGLYWKFQPLPETDVAERKRSLQGHPEKAALPPLVAEMNERNSRVKSVLCENVGYVVRQSGNRFRLTGKVCYEKPKNFRMLIDSVLGREVDIGSNDKEFWYWSRRDKSPGLHYAAHEDFPKTRLKTPFNPAFLRASLGFEEWAAEGVRVTEDGGDVMLTYRQTDGSGRPVLFSVIVNKAKKRADGYSVSDANGKPVATCEIKQFDGDSPSQILYDWQEEGRVMLMTMPNVSVNVKINASMWTAPDYKPKKNMATE